MIRKGLRMAQKFKRDDEWDNEPDTDDFEAYGLFCAMRRNDFGSWCGYVGIPDEHPLYTHNFENLELEVHGGLSYSGYKFKKNNGIHKKAKPIWWFGFDCSHYGDLMPINPTTFFDGEYRNYEYTKKQCINLAKQLSSFSS